MALTRQPATPSPRALLVAYHSGNRYLIAEDEPEVGVYLHRFVGDGPFSTYDYVQDSERAAREFALEMWSVPLGLWQSVL